MTHLKTMPLHRPKISPPGAAVAGSPISVVQVLVGRRTADLKGAKQPLQITRVADLPDKGSPTPGSRHPRLCSQSLVGVQRGASQLKAVKGVIVLLKGQASSCWCAMQPPFVCRANALKGHKTQGGDELLPLPLGEQGMSAFHPPSALQKAAQSHRPTALSLP